MKSKTKDIKITISPEKAEEFFYNALCNGMVYFSQYGFVLDYANKDAIKAKASWKKKNPGIVMCREDLWMEILRTGGTLVFEDLECEGEYTRHLILKNVHDKVALTPFRYLSEMIEENDDADTADMMIQSVLFDGEIIFG